MQVSYVRKGSKLIIGHIQLHQSLDVVDLLSHLSYLVVPKEAAGEPFDLGQFGREVRDLVVTQVDNGQFGEGTHSLVKRGNVVVLEFEASQLAPGFDPCRDRSDVVVAEVDFVQ